MIKKQPSTLAAFIAGVLFWGGAHMAFQDNLGLEDYISYCRAHWVDLPWGVGALICLLTLSFVLVLFFLEWRTMRIVNGVIEELKRRAPKKLPWPWCN
jgi:uncharacterized membrane protein